MKFTPVAAAFALAACSAIALPAIASAQTLPATYTAAQATAGAKLYEANCTMCHGAKLEGTAAPQLAGADFLKKFSGQTADDVHYIVSTQMPLTAPASLKPSEYIALMAFILQKNKYPAGETPLDAAKLKTIKFK